MLVTPSGELRAAVFDCDGLLIDSSHCWHAGYRRLLAVRGQPLRSETVAELNGASVRIAADHLGVDAHDLRDALRDAATASPATSLPGAGRLLDSLSGRVPMAVATNGPVDVVRDLLARAGLLHHFEHVLSAESLRRDKPAPDVYLAACDALDVPPSAAVALEDSSAGVRAARAAGLVVAYVPSDPTRVEAADLCVPRLDDPRLLAFLGLDARQPHAQR